MLDVYADISVSNEGKEDQIVRVGHAEANSGRADEKGFPMRIVAEYEAVGLRPDVAPQKDTQHPSRNDEPLPIVLEKEIGCLLPFVLCQNAPQIVPTSVGGSHVHAPHVDLIASQHQRGRRWRPKRITGRHTCQSRHTCPFSCSFFLSCSSRSISLLRNSSRRRTSEDSRSSCPAARA